jgi:hypothetical protein
MNSGICIKSVEQLKQESYRENGDFVHFYIRLAGGLARSSKRMSYRPEESTFLIINEIDESYQEVPEMRLPIDTMISETINKECLFCND